MTSLLRSVAYYRYVRVSSTVHSNICTHCMTHCSVLQHVLTEHANRQDLYAHTHTHRERELNKYHVMLCHVMSLLGRFVFHVCVVMPTFPCHVPIALCGMNS